MADFTGTLVYTPGQYTPHDIREILGRTGAIGIAVYNDHIIWKPQNNLTQQWIDSENNIYNNPEYNIYMDIQWGIDLSLYDELGDYTKERVTSMSSSYFKKIPGFTQLWSNDLDKGASEQFMGYFDNAEDVTALGFEYMTPEQLGAEDGAEYAPGLPAGLNGIFDKTVGRIERLFFSPIYNYKIQSAPMTGAYLAIVNYNEKESWWTSDDPIVLPKLFVPYVGYYTHLSKDSRIRYYTCMYLGVERKK